MEYIFLKKQSSYSKSMVSLLLNKKIIYSWQIVHLPVKGGKNAFSYLVREK